MHCLLLADLAAILSQHASSLLATAGRVPDQALTDYWLANRNRLEFWHRALGRYRRAQEAADWTTLRRWWQDHTGLLEEVLVSEMLTRVVAALGTEIDRKMSTEEIGPITDAVHRSHVEARHRVQQVMIDGRGCSVPDAVRLNRLRQGVERWTDALIGRMAMSQDTLDEYAFDIPRALDYARDAREQGLGSSRNTANWLMNAAMHDMLFRRTGDRTATPSANQRIAASVLRMLRADRFDSLGILKSSRLARVEADFGAPDRMPQTTGTEPFTEAWWEAPRNPEPTPPEDQPRAERWYL